LELRGIGRITGEAGSGKTTVCRKVAAALHPGQYRGCYVPLSTGHVMDMDKSIGWELGRPTERNRAAAFRTIRTEITRLSLDRLYPCGSAHFSPLGRVATDFLADQFFQDVAMHVKYWLLPYQRACAKS
jgi:hypothetical protein